jgi:putative salt-induced outer membrane protein
MNNNITQKLTAIVFGSVIATTNTFAAEEPASEVLFGGWSGKASLGATTSTGNAETSNINGSIRLGKTVNKWEHIVFGSLFKGESAIIVEQVEDGVVVEDEDGLPVREIVRGDNSDRLALGYTPRYYWKPNTYVFGVLDWERDKPAGIKTATRQVIGIGHRFFADQSGFLSAEVGFGNKTTDLVSGDDINGGIGYVGLNYLNRVTENVTFNADLRADFGSDNTFTEIGLGVAFKVSEKMALGISHFTRGNSDITDAGNPFDSNNDSVTTLNLVVDI